MGSWLSILNNTNDTWAVKIGPDEAALSIVDWIVIAAGAVTTILSAGAAAAPLLALLASNGVVSLCGLSVAALASGSALALDLAIPTFVVTLTSAVTSKIATGIHGQLCDELGMDSLAPGEKKSYWRTLSLWQQGTCLRTRANPKNSNEIIVEKLYMRPIFSGSTNRSERVHEIQFWLDKFGVEDVKTLPLNPRAKKA